jgi:cytoskeletal protein CcmA (bactofilin family)
VQFQPLSVPSLSLVLVIVSIGSIIPIIGSAAAINRAKQGEIVFSKSKSKVVDTVQAAASSDPTPSVELTPRSPKAASAPEPANLEPTGRVASISRGTSIVGKIVCDGAVNIFGRIEGEVRGASVNVCEGAHVDGNLFAEELIVGGSVRGTIEATRVKLQSTADVKGDICHQLLSIEENAQFDGTSKRVTKATESRSSVQSSAGWPLQVRAETQSEVVPMATAPGVASE